MIKGYCHTNIDQYKREEWPTEFVAVPLVGDSVEAKSGKTLRVCAITHKMSPLAKEPMVKIELWLHEGMTLAMLDGNKR